MGLSTKEMYPMKLTRFDGNPILRPIPASRWENACTCNPTAWYDGRKVRLLYRAGPDDRVHPIYLGLAESTDGLRFRRVGKAPLFGPSADGWDAGCIEDPRIVRIDGLFLLTYAARMAPPGPYWKGVPLNAHIPAWLKTDSAPAAAKWNLTRSGLAVSRDLRHWRRLGPITGAAVDDRDAILFPERIGTRFALLHRPATWTGPDYGCDKPSIWISTSDDLLNWREERILAQPAFDWESRKIGGSTPPIRTKRGWLTLYHGVDEASVYRVGAMMLDLENPLKILGRSREPILEPETDEERNGLVRNVVFPCGNIVKDGTLFVYYGGADTVCCVATAELDELVDHVMSSPPRRAARKPR